MAVRVMEECNPADGDSGVESNARLTGAAAGVLIVLLAAEGATVLSVRSLLSAHVFIGMILVPPVLLKIGSTGWRFVRYYNGDAAYRRKGPPQIVLRLLGPVVVILTIVLFASGIALIPVGGSVHGRLLTVHKASFVLWFAAMTIHVLGHLGETARLAPADWVRRTRRDVKGAGLRLWALASSVVVGCVLGVVMLGPTASYHVHPSDRGASGPSGVSQLAHRTSYPKLVSTLSGP
ncbi:MAG TPA: hypothetical protein VFV02_07805 [Acidimicrobiales bacterium]|nr:hypothetical protein [Acidimicrobiales bacterium]